LSEEQVVDIEQKAKAQIEAAAQFAIESPYPTSEEMYEDIFA
jgi:TPP-dependent pyruvate/acetoin dehydrogenase alpha subunit